MASGPIISWQIDGETVETVADFIFWAPKSLQMVTAVMKLKDAYSLEGKLWPAYPACCLLSCFSRIQLCATPWTGAHQALLSMGHSRQEYWRGLSFPLLTDLDSILKSRDITLSTKVHLVKDVVFPVVMYGCESWTIRKAECQRIDAFELWCWRSLLRVPWTARRSNQSILKEISPECSLEGLMLKLKL